MSYTEQSKKFIEMLESKLKEIKAEFINNSHTLTEEDVILILDIKSTKLLRFNTWRFTV